METFNEQSKVLIDVWKKNIESGQFFDVVPYIARCTLEIICGEYVLQIVLVVVRNYVSRIFFNFADNENLQWG